MPSSPKWGYDRFPLLVARVRTRKKLQREAVEVPPQRESDSDERFDPVLILENKFNLELSQRRAESVKAYLVSKGVDASLIQAEGRGEADPVVNCPDPTRNGEIKNFRQLIQCLAPNRRAVVEVSGTRPAE